MEVVKPADNIEDTDDSYSSGNVITEEALLFLEKEEAEVRIKRKIPQTRSIYRLLNLLTLFTKTTQIL